MLIRLIVRLGLSKVNELVNFKIMKKKKQPANKVQDNISYLKNTNVAEALRVVEESRNLPHLQKPIKYLTK